MDPAAPPDVSEADGAGAAGAEEWKRRGNDAYKEKAWAKAVQCYSLAIKSCTSASHADLETTCLNNRAACHAQLKEHTMVVQDATEVIRRQPANSKALLRRMIALEALGRRNEALEDAAAVLTMEPKNPHALQVVDRKRRSLGRTSATECVQNCGEHEQHEPMASLGVMLFTENCPLHCYACLQSVLRHVKGVRLKVHVFWKATVINCVPSYQLLQSLKSTFVASNVEITWIEVSAGQILEDFSRLINRLTVAGERHVLLLSDKVLFHTDFDASAGLNLLNSRPNEVFTLRLDLNPRIHFFPDASLIAASPALRYFANDPQLCLWTRWYDKSKMAYEAVALEVGWDAILDWTATIIRAEHVQLFFSALMPSPGTFQELRERAADWLSRRQRMKQSELSHSSACYAFPLLVAVGPDILSDQVPAEHALRRLLFNRSVAHRSTDRFAKEVEWTLDEVDEYFKDVAKPNDDAVETMLETLLEPERFRNDYLECIVQSRGALDLILPTAIVPQSPLVSWLVPVRNAEYFILDCLQSIDFQKGVDRGVCEVVLIDDASEDKTLAILRKYAAERPNIQIVENRSQHGVASSLREGWAKCRGDFVVRLDADDLAEPDRLRLQLQYLEKHPSISLLGCRTRPFWTEERRCSIERIAQKEDGRVVATAWREFHGTQTSRRREQIAISEKGREVMIVDGPAEYEGCRVISIGENSLALGSNGWQSELQAIQGYGASEIVLQRRDPLEHPKGAPVLHPLLLRATLNFEDCVDGTTAVFRRYDFESCCPYEQEEAETYWCWLSASSSSRHIANLAEPLVRSRRHAECRRKRDESGIYESQCAALKHHLKKSYGIEADMRDAEALLNFRGPRDTEHGNRLLEAIEKIERSLIAEYVRPAEDQRGDFWRDFVQGHEVALERALASLRMRFRRTHEEIKRVITSSEKSPRNRNRDLPR